MARIFRTDIYDYDTLPSLEDYVIGTDSEDSLRTKNYRISDIIDLFSAGTSTFVTLTDTPSSYAGQTGLVPIVNVGEDALEFAPIADDTTYGPSWDANQDAATKGRIFSKMETLVTTNTTQDITGLKTFTQIGTFNNGLSAFNDIFMYGTNQAAIRMRPYNTGTTPNMVSSGVITTPAVFMNDDGDFSMMQLDATFYQSIAYPEPTADRIHTLQDQSGTLAHLSDIIANTVDSVFSRSGAVVATAGDYDAFYYTEAESDGKYLLNTTDTLTGTLTVTGDVTVTDEAYAVGWNASLEVPTKNAVYDKIETIAGSIDDGTPSLTATGATYTATTETWNFARSGRVGTFNAVMSSISTTGTPTGNLTMTMTGLALADTPLKTTDFVVTMTNGDVNFYSIVAQVPAGQTAFTFKIQDTLDASNTETLAAVDFTNGTIRISGSYITNS